MFSIFIPNILGFAWFLIAIFFSFYVPGIVVLGNVLKNKPHFEKIIIGLTVGMVLWALQGFAFGFAHARFLTYIYLLIFSLIFFKSNKFNLKKFKLKKPTKFIYLIIAIFVIGIFGQNLQFFISGFIFPSGIYSIMADAPDSLWHTSVISELIRRFPPIQPGLSGVMLYNYHYLSDLVVSELIRIFHLPLLATQFQYSSLLFSFLLGGNAYVLTRTLKFPNAAVAIFVYFQYFSSDVIYLITLFTRRFFEFTVHPLEDGTMFLENPPRALSYIALLCSLYLLFHLFKTRTKRLAIITALTLGAIIGFKVHTAFGVLGGLGILSLYLLFKRDYKLLLFPILTFIVMFAIHVPVNGTAGIPFYSPFEMSTMFAVQPKLQLSHLELARQIYHNAHNTFGEWRYYLIMLALFLIGQFGIKNAGWFPSKKIFEKTGIPLGIFLIGALASLLIVGTFFYQPIGGADIFNFYLAFALLLGFFAAFNLGEVFNKSRLAAILVILIIIITTFPRWIYETKYNLDFLGNSELVFSSDDLNSLKFIKNNTEKNAVILVNNKGQADSVYPYISSFSERDTFLSGQTVLYGHSIPYKDREEIAATIFDSVNSNIVKKDILANHIGYIYFYGNPKLPTGLKKINLKKIFSNKSATIYKVL